MEILVRNLSEHHKSLIYLDAFLRGFANKGKDTEISDLTEVELNVVLQSISLLLSPMKTLLVRAKGLGRRRLNGLYGSRVNKNVADSAAKEPVKIKEEEKSMGELCDLVEPDSQDMDGDADGNGPEVEPQAFRSPTRNASVSENSTLQSERQNESRNRRSSRRKRRQEEVVTDHESSELDIENANTDMQETDHDWALENNARKNKTSANDTDSNSDSEPEELSIVWPIFRFHEGYFHCHFNPCDYKTRRKKDVRKHMLGDKHAEQFEKEIAPIDRRKYKCTECDKGFPTSWKLKEHERTHRNRNENMGNLKPFGCQRCSYQCKKKSDLRKHEETHETVKRHKCPTCFKLFKTSASLKMHKTNFHLKPPEPALLCSQCGATFKNGQGLKQHLQIKHSKKRPFKCTQCPKAYKVKGGLKVHLERAHSEVI